MAGPPKCALCNLPAEPHWQEDKAYLSHCCFQCKRSAGREHAAHCIFYRRLLLEGKAAVPSDGSNTLRSMRYAILTKQPARGTKQPNASTVRADSHREAGEYISWKESKPASPKLSSSCKEEKPTPDTDSRCNKKHEKETGYPKKQTGKPTSQSWQKLAKYTGTSERQQQRDGWPQVHCYGRAWRLFEAIFVPTDTTFPLHV